jgi:hypothetical protein
MSEILKESRPQDKDKWEANLAHLSQQQISTAADWLNTSKKVKAGLEKAGLPESVINSLDDAVRTGLLMPAFKYVERVQFLREKPYVSCGESLSIIQLAQTVDDSWVLTRKDCDALCLNYARMMELLLKLVIEKHNTLPDTHFQGLMQSKKTRYKVVHTIKPQGEEPRHFLKRFPPTHNLFELVVLVEEVTSFVPATETRQAALDAVTNCAGGVVIYDGEEGDSVEEVHMGMSRIACGDFYEATQSIDILFLDLLKFLQDNTSSVTRQLPRQWLLPISPI